MELNRLQKLAGLPLTESKAPEVLAEASNEAKIDGTFAKQSMGQMGDICILFDDGKVIKQLAEMLGLSGDWKKTKMPNGTFASYLSGDRLSFYTSEHDYNPDEFED